MRATIRLRLALVHTLLFLAMTVALVTGIYYLTARSTTASSQDPRSRVERALGLPPGTLTGGRSLPGATPSLPVRPHGPSLRDVATGVQAQTRTELLARLVAFSAALVLAMTILSFVLGWLMAGRSLRPLRRITARAKTISEQNLHEPIALQGPRDELHELADTFDEMLARLDRAFEGQRLFAANASHELRTPLTRIRAKLDVTLAQPNITSDDLEEMASTIRDAVDRSAALIDGLLALARAQGELDRQAVALEDLVRGAIDDRRGSVSERRISLTTSLEPAATSGDPVLLEHLVLNLLENAITHNIEGGSIDIRTETREGMARLHMSNGGARLPPSSVEALFLPLHRGSDDRMMHTGRAGFGLGLAIVKAVTEAHRGRVRATPITEGGLSIDVALPGIDPGGVSQALPSASASRDVKAASR